MERHLGNPEEFGGFPIGGDAIKGALCHLLSAIDANPCL
jgi:hypothetical protein